MEFRDFPGFGRRMHSKRSVCSRRPCRPPALASIQSGGCLRVRGMARTLNEANPLGPDDGNSKPR